jgi:hypothetical protein
MNPDEEKDSRDIAEEILADVRNHIQQYGVPYDLRSAVPALARAVAKQIVRLRVDHYGEKPAPIRHDHVVLQQEAQAAVRDIAHAIGLSTATVPSVVVQHVQQLHETCVALQQVRQLDEGEMAKRLRDAMDDREHAISRAEELEGGLARMSALYDTARTKLDAAVGENAVLREDVKRAIRVQESLNAQLNDIAKAYSAIRLSPGVAAELVKLKRTYDRISKCANAVLDTGESAAVLNLARVTFDRYISEQWLPSKDLDA